MTIGTGCPKGDPGVVASLRARAQPAGGNPAAAVQITAVALALVVGGTLTPTRANTCVVHSVLVAVPHLARPGRPGSTAPHPLRPAVRHREGRDRGLFGGPTARVPPARRRWARQRWPPRRAAPGRLESAQMDRRPPSPNQRRRRPINPSRPRPLPTVRLYPPLRRTRFSAQPISASRPVPVQAGTRRGGRDRAQQPGPAPAVLNPPTTRMPRSAIHRETR